MSSCSPAEMRGQAAQQPQRGDQQFPQSTPQQGAGANGAHFPQQMQYAQQMPGGAAGHFAGGAGGKRKSIKMQKKLPNKTTDH